MTGTATFVGALWSGAGIAAAAEVSNVGPDYAGLAALITACSGFLATVGAIFIGVRKRSENDNKVIELLQKMVEKPPPKEVDDEE